MFLEQCHSDEIAAGLLCCGSAVPCHSVLCYSSIKPKSEQATARTSGPWEQISLAQGGDGPWAGLELSKVWSQEMSRAFCRKISLTHVLMAY